MNAYILLLALIGSAGLAVGSFLNVLAYRQPRGESLFFPDSHCPNCMERIRWRHNLPVVGWMLLRGRCASCKDRISARYPIVEAITGALFVGVAIRFGLTVELPAYLFLVSVGVALALMEYDGGRVPDSIVLPSYVIAALLLMPAGAARDDQWSAYRGLIGMAALWTIYFALNIAYPNGVGLSDVKIAGMLGLYLGYVGWGAVLVGAFGGIVLSGCVGLLAAGVRAANAARTARSTVITHGGVAVRSGTALGTYMIAAAVLALFVAAPVSTWYGSLLVTS